MRIPIVDQQTDKQTLSFILTQAFDHPEAITADFTSGKVFIVDTRNHRVLRFADLSHLASGDQAEAVLGQPDLLSTDPATGANRMHFPLGVAIDHNGSLWVADTANHRVLRFDHAAHLHTGAPASIVLGQLDFSSGTATPSAGGMNRPTGIAFDQNSNLWVADSFNNRVLRFGQVADLHNGAPASTVLGQPGFGRSAAVAGPQGMYRPRSVACDHNDNLWVADSANHRVLRFDNAAHLPTSAPASVALGQPDLFRNAPASDASGMHNPSAVALDQNGQLWVADTFNSRVLGFRATARLSSGAAASMVLGQNTMTASSPTNDPQGLHHPFGLAVDPHRGLWVADTFHNRVLLFRLER